MKTKRLLLVLALAASGAALADVVTTTTAKKIINNVTDGNLTLTVKDGGVLTDALTVTGSTSVVSLNQPLPIASGGTNKALTLSNGGMCWSDSNSLEILAAGSSGQILTSGGAATPAWVTLLPLANGGTNKAVTAVNGGLAYTDSDSFEISAAGTAQQWVLSGGAGAPTMSNTTTTGKFIDGSVNETQLRVQGHSTQTSAVILAEDSAGTDLLYLSNAGALSVLGPVLAPDGSTSAPAFSFGGDTDTGIYTSSSNVLAFAAAGSTPAILTSAVFRLFDVQIQAEISGGVSAPDYSFDGDTDSGMYRSGTNQVSIATGGVETIRFEATNAVRAAGKIGAGKSPTSYFDTSINTFSSANGYGLRIVDTDTAVDSTNILSQMEFNADGAASGGTYISFHDGDGEIGSIVVLNTTSVSYLTTSDARLKKNGVEITDGVDRVKRIIPRYYEWVEDGSQGEGYFAQELQGVVPFAVIGSPDGDLKTDPMGVDYGKVTPVLTAALKEVITRLEAVESEFAEYKAAHP